ncbi:MAG: TRAM domain-containing protein, partial [Lachnospiraceae bacterium]|nr:TRAM domain-containing protein [Lachnospiraceae bacterium]
MEFKKNGLVELTIEDFSENGEGIGKIDGYTLFVKDAILGDRVEALITKAKKNYGFARLTKIIESSPYRIDPPCSISRSCGGCQIQALSYKEQLEYKKRKVKSDLVRIGGFERDLIEEIFEGIEGMREPYRYRNKTQLPVGRDKKGKIISGFYAKRTHDIIECENCIIGPKENKIASDIILKHMIKYGIEPYDEKNGEGKIRHVLLRKGFETGEISICIVTKNEEIKSEVYKKNQPKKHKKITEETDAKSRGKTKEFIPHEAEL